MFGGLWQAGDDAACARAVPRQVAGAPVHGAAGAGPVPRGQGHGDAVPGARRPPPVLAARARRTARRTHRLPRLQEQSVYNTLTLQQTNLFVNLLHRFIK